MLFIFTYFKHRNDWSVLIYVYVRKGCTDLVDLNVSPSKKSKVKQSERELRLRKLDKSYHSPVQKTEKNQIFAKPIATLVKQVHDGLLDPLSLLKAYGKVAIKAHQRTNCLTEIMIPECEKWLSKSEINLQGPLAGIPVSLKDSVEVGGFDASLGYSMNTNDPCREDGALVRLLKQAGALPFVKTNIPITLYSFESYNDVWGRTVNPHNHKYTCGGSTGGEAALLACGGSRIGIGTDLAGSQRIPAAWSGCYTLRCSAGRWPISGVRSSAPGQEGIPGVAGPMARSLDDLCYFTRSIIEMKPWKYDPTVHPLEWRQDIMDEYSKPSKKLVIGVYRDDGVVPPTPACSRALNLMVDALKKDGHDVFDVVNPSEPVDPKSGLILALRLISCDGFKTVFSKLRFGETTSFGAKVMIQWFPTIGNLLRRLYTFWLRYIKRDYIQADLCESFGNDSVFQLWKLVNKREEFRRQWHSWWENGCGQKLSNVPPDAILTVPNAMPALPNEAAKELVASCGYSLLFNMLDYSAGIVPVSYVDETKDALSFDNATANANLQNQVARTAYSKYDAHAMNGLPIAIQVVGRRLQEEKVLALMRRLDSLVRSITTDKTFSELTLIEGESTP